MKIYIDKDFHCHKTNPNNEYREFEVPFFDGKCTTFIEGYMYIPENEIWERSDGMTFEGPIRTPWKDYAELDNAQREYERQLLKELQENSIPVADLENAYREGVDSVYD